MKRAVLCALLTLLPVFVVMSCANEEDLSHVLEVVNASTIGVASIGLGYSGVKSRATMPPDIEIAASVPAGQTKTVELTLDSASNFYRLFIYNDTKTRIIVWTEGVPDGEHVLLSKGGSSTCTLTEDQATCFAGENVVKPFIHNWVP